MTKKKQKTTRHFDWLVAMGFHESLEIIITDGKTIWFILGKVCIYFTNTVSNKYHNNKPS